MSTPDLEDRLVELDDSLGEFQASDPTPWEIALIFNAILEEVKSGHGDDPVVRSIGTLEQSSASSLAVVRKLTSLSPGPTRRPTSALCAPPSSRSWSSSTQRDETAITISDGASRVVF